MTAPGRSRRRVALASTLSLDAADLHAEAVRAVPAVVAHFGLSAEGEAFLRAEVRDIPNARACVVAVARSLWLDAASPRRQRRMEKGN